MKYSQGAFRTIRQTKDEYEAKSHELLVKAGFIDQVGSGLYSLLPLGKKVVTKIESIIRWHLVNTGAQEIQMPSLQPKGFWDKSGRWNNVDVLFKVQSQHADDFGLAPTAEEIITPLAQRYIQSYRDLPLSFFQITTKFRDEPRPKSGILRGREFIMKDMYSFHSTSEDFKSYYQLIIDVYLKIFAAMGLNQVKITEASGGSFSKKHSHEFNVITPAGEVDLIYCESCEFAQNDEVAAADLSICPKCNGVLKKDRAVEIGNIFDLGTRFSESFNLSFTNEKGNTNKVFMGCYGIGVSRLLGAIVELSNDNDGIIWPKTLTPAQVHLIDLAKENKGYAEAIYKTLRAEGITVLFDDRQNAQAGEKFADADLIGIPIRLVISDRNGRQVEWKERGFNKTILFDIQKLILAINDFYQV